MRCKTKSLILILLCLIFISPVFSLPLNLNQMSGKHWMLMPDHEKTNIVRGYLLGSLYLAKVLSQEDNNLIPILERHLITSSSVKSIIQKTNTFYENPDYFSIEIYAAIYIANYKETPVEPDNQPTNEDQT